MASHYPILSLDLPRRNLESLAEPSLSVPPVKTHRRPPLTPEPPVRASAGPAMRTLRDSSSPSPSSQLPKFAITPAKVVAQASTSLISTPADHFIFCNGGGAQAQAQAQPQADGSSSRLAPLSSQSSKKKPERRSPMQKVLASGSRVSPEPVVSSVLGRAEVGWKGKSRMDLEKGLDRVFARHDIAVERADGLRPMFGRPKRKRNLCHHTNKPLSSLPCTAPSVQADSDVFASTLVATPVRNPITQGSLVLRHTERPYDDDESDIFSEQILTPTTIHQRTSQPRFISIDAFAFSNNDDQSSTFSLAAYSDESLSSPRKRAPSPLVLEQAIPDGGVDEEEREEIETCARIDDLSARIRAMVLEGQEALLAPLTEPIPGSAPDGDEDDDEYKGDDDIVQKWTLRFLEAEASWMRVEDEEALKDDWKGIFRGSSGKTNIMQSGVEDGKSGAHRKVESAETEGTDRRVELVRCRSLGLLVHSGVEVL